MGASVFIYIEENKCGYTFIIPASLVVIIFL